MSDPAIDEFVRRAEDLYDGQLKAVLERDHLDEYVAVDPDSGEYFLGKTLGEAARAARQSCPNRPTHLMRVGHKAALQLGMRLQ